MVTCAQARPSVILGDLRFCMNDYGCCLKGKKKSPFLLSRIWTWVLRNYIQKTNHLTYHLNSNGEETWVSEIKYWPLFTWLWTMLRHQKSWNCSFNIDWDIKILFLRRGREKSNWNKAETIISAPLKSPKNKNPKTSWDWTCKQNVNQKFNLNLM